MPGMDVGSYIGSIGSESGSRRQSIAGHPASGTSLHANSPRPILHVCVTNYPITPSLFIIFPTTDGPAWIE